MESISAAHRTLGPRHRSGIVAVVMATGLTLGASGCSQDSSGSDDVIMTTGADGAVTTVAAQGVKQARLASSPDPVLTAPSTAAVPAAVEVSQALFASAPVAVVAAASDSAGIATGTEQAKKLGVPLLLVPGAGGSGDDAAATSSPATATGGDEAAATATSGPDAAGTTSAPGLGVVQDELTRLGVEQVLAVGESVPVALGEVSGVEVVTDAGDLVEVTPPVGADGLAVLVQGAQDDPSRAATAASAEAAGAQVIPVATDDLRSDPAAVSALADLKPSTVLAVGAGFGSVEQLSGRLASAQTGVQLPGGGQALFPGRRLIAMYGHPGTPGLGVLGEQDLDATIVRAKELAAQYEELSEVPVVPTFEIITTTAQASAGADGDYSAETQIEKIRPWVDKAGEEGVYVVLDLQPGRANFLDQAKIYDELLREPHVGLALDPEWRLKPNQRPLQQIGGVEAEEVNSVIEWLGDLTAEEKLPQKLLVLHQFRLDMLRDQDEIDMSGRDEVAVLIHMDGQGAPDLKDGTWNAVVNAAPEGLPMGWKNFYDEDQPMLTPEQTMQREPTPLMVSYQ